MQISWSRLFPKGTWCATIALLVVLGASGCRTETGVGDGRLQIVTTTGMIADAAREIVGAHAEVTSLMGPGVDPHLYKATQGDLFRLLRARAVFYNGLHLEGKMGEVLEKLARRREVVAITDQIPRADLRSPPEFEGAYDPHVWFDVRLWSRAVGSISDAIVRIDSANADEYRRNTAAYQRRLDSLDGWVRQQIATIPVERRVLITAHDAFGYFGRAYAIEVRGLQGISTVSEFGLRDIASLVDLIVSRRVRAAFVESSVPRKSIEAVVAGVRARGQPFSIGGELYSDAMGELDTPEGTYIGMVTANVNRIVGALR